MHACWVTFGAMVITTPMLQPVLWLASRTGNRCKNNLLQEIGSRIYIGTCISTVALYF